MSDEPREKDADDDSHPAPFKVAKAMMEAGSLRADLEDPDLGERMEAVVSMRLKPDAESDEQPKGGIYSISTLEPKDHLQVLMEATQQFAKQIGYPLEMMFLNKESQEG